MSNDNSFTAHEEKIISECGIYKGCILRSVILIYKKQNKQYDLSELLELSRKSLTKLKRQLKSEVSKK